MRASRILAYCWACPNTCLGLILLPLTWFGQGNASVVAGVCEIHGPAIAFILARCTLLRGGALALTLGHVVIGRDQNALDLTREHERVHVRQYERWGPFFLPAYLVFSIVARLGGSDAYRDNRFEREAFGRDGTGKGFRV